MFQKLVLKTGTNFWYQKTSPVFVASDMQFGTDFLWYQFSGSAFGADFWNVCHWP